MAIFTTNQRRSLRWDGSSWQEEVLAASGVEVDDSGFSTVSGSEVQELLDNIDNVLTGFDVATASGIIIIDDVSNVSGTVGGVLDNLDVLNLSDSADSVFRFSFTAPVQPVDPVNVRVLFAPRGNGSGNLKLDLDYNLFEQGDDVNPGSFTYAKTDTVAIASSSEDLYKLLSFQIPTTEFSSAGSAPFIVSCQVTRDVSVGSNFADDVSVISIYVDNLPGGVLGSTAGYIGGNLTVTGDLTVEGLTVLEGGDVPASGTAAGVSGSLVIDDDFIYAAVDTNKWKRTSIANF